MGDDTRVGAKAIRRPGRPSSGMLFITAAADSDPLGRKAEPATTLKLYAVAGSDPWSPVETRRPARVHNAFSDCPNCKRSRTSTPPGLSP